MFCPKCGAENKVSSKFCLKCGHEFKPANLPVAPVEKTRVMPRIRMNNRERPEYQAAPEPRIARNPEPPASMERPQNATSVTRFVFAGLGLVFIVLLNMPWIEANFYVATGSFSIPQLVKMALDSGSTLSQLGVSEVEKYVAMMDMIGAVLAFAWIVALGLLIVGIYRDVRGSRHLHVGFLASALLAVFFIVGISAFKTLAVDQMESIQVYLQQALDEVIKVGPMAYATAALGIVAFVGSVFVPSEG